MMQMLLFFLLGLLAFPSQMPSIVLPSIAIALFLTFVARPAAVGLLLAPSKPPIGQYLVISWAGLRVRHQSYLRSWRRSVRDI